MKFSGLKDWMYKQRIVNTLRKDEFDIADKNMPDRNRINQSMNAVM